MKNKCMICTAPPEILNLVNEQCRIHTEYKIIQQMCAEKGFKVSRATINAHANKDIEGYTPRSQLPRDITTMEGTQQPLGGFAGSLGALDIEKELNLQGDWDLSFNVGKGLEKIIKRQILITLAHQSASVKSGQLPKPEAFRGLYVAAGVVKLLQDVLMKAGKRLDSEELSLDSVLAEIEAEEKRKSLSMEEFISNIEETEDPQAVADFKNFINDPDSFYKYD